LTFTSICWFTIRLKKIVLKSLWVDFICLPL